MYRFKRSVFVVYWARSLGRCGPGERRFTEIWIKNDFRIVKLMLGLKTSHSARCILRGVELMHMIKKSRCSTNRVDRQPNNSIAWQPVRLSARLPLLVRN